jgi:hypothetical protein
MNILVVVVVLLSLGGRDAVASDRLQPTSQSAVALAIAVSGDVVARTSPSDDAVNTSRDVVKLRLFDRMVAGDTIETRPGASLVLVFKSGRRERIPANTTVRITDDGAQAVSGVVEPLTHVAVLPVLTPLPPGTAGTGMTAVRIRSGEVRTRYPRGTATLADRTVLEFDVDRTYRGQLIEIEDEGAAIVLREAVDGARLEVPAGVLRTGTRYRWRVTARSAGGVTARGDGSFTTLDADTGGARASFVQSIDRDDPTSLLLLAEVDMMLGLWREALEGFTAAQLLIGRGSDSDGEIAARLQAIEARRQPLGVQPYRE